MSDAHAEAVRFPILVCPRCRAAVRKGGEAYACGGCGATYPILFGIPDFRLQGDRYLTLDQERAKAAKLAAFAQDHSFDELLDYYYQITDDVTPDRAARFAHTVRQGVKRANAALHDLAPSPGGALLDAGCGAGAALIAGQGRFGSVVGLDVALRWLVIAKKRLEERGLPAVLVCGHAEAPPFADGQFSHVLALDLVEHTEDPRLAITAFARQLEPGGRCWLSASNVYWLGPHPATGQWAAGVTPPSVRAWLSRARGYDPLRNVTPISTTAIRRAAADAGLEVRSIAPRSAPASERERPSLTLQAYRGLAASPLARPLLREAGPAFEAILRKP